MATIPRRVTNNLKPSLRKRPVDLGRVPAQRRAPAAVGAELDARFTNQGGPIVQTPEVYVSFWGTSWNTNTQKTSNLIQFVEDFLASNYMNVLSQYSVGQGAGQCGAYQAQSARSALTGDLTDTDVHTNIQALIDNGDLPEPGDPCSVVLLIFLDENVRVNDPNFVVMCETNGDTAFGYHYYFTTKAGHKFYYAVIPALSDICLTNSCPQDQTCSLHLSEMQEQRRTQVASHEFSEMVTDPEISAWRDPTTGAENGDDCNGSSGVITVNGRTWTVQQMYSRTDDVSRRTACVLTPPDPIPPIGVQSSPQAQGNSMQPGEVLNP